MPLRTIEALLAKKRKTRPELCHCSLTLASLRAVAAYWLTKGQEPESRCEADNADADAEMFCGLAFRRAEHFDATTIRRFAVTAARASLIAMAVCAPYGVDQLIKKVGYDGDSFARHVGPSHSRSPISVTPMRMRG